MKFISKLKKVSITLVFTYMKTYEANIKFNGNSQTGSGSPPMNYIDISLIEEHIQLALRLHKMILLSD